MKQSVKTDLKQILTQILNLYQIFDSCAVKFSEILGA